MVIAPDFAGKVGVGFQEERGGSSAEKGAAMQELNRLGEAGTPIAELCTLVERYNAANPLYRIGRFYVKDPTAPDGLRWYDAKTGAEAPRQVEYQRWSS